MTNNPLKITLCFFTTLLALGLSWGTLQLYYLTNPGVHTCNVFWQDPYFWGLFVLLAIGIYKAFTMPNIDEHE